MSLLCVGSRLHWQNWAEGGKDTNPLATHPRQEVNTEEKPKKKKEANSKNPPDFCLCKRGLQKGKESVVLCITTTMLFCENVALHTSKINIL